MWGTLNMRPGAALCLFQFALIVFSSGASLAAEDSTWTLRLTYADGRVGIQRAGSEGWVKADSGAIIEPGDKIRAFQKSLAELMSSDGQAVRLGQSTTLSFWGPKVGDTISIEYMGVKNSPQSFGPPREDGIVKRLEPYPAIEVVEWKSHSSRGKLSVRYAVSAGEVWSSVKVAQENSGMSFDLMMREASASVLPCGDSSRATFRISVGNDSTCQIKAYDGRLIVFFTTIGSSADSVNSSRYPEWNARKSACDLSMSEKSLVVGSQQKLILNSYGEIAYMGPFSPDDIDEKTDWVKWNQSRDKAE